MKKRIFTCILLAAAALFMNGGRIAEAKKPAPNPCQTQCALTFFTSIQACGTDFTCVQNAYNAYVSCALSCPR